MHTVFINASDHPIDGRIDVLSMEKEYKEIFVMDCPLSQWSDWDKGYEKCAIQIGEQIDTYKEINNDFNLIAYVDLAFFKEYADQYAVETSMDQQIRQNVTYELIRAAMTRFFATTIYAKLDDLGRVPSEKLLLLLEENERSNESLGTNGGDEKSGYLSAKEKIKVHMLMHLLGFPQVDALEEQLKDLSKTEKKEKLEKTLSEGEDRLKVLDLRKLYQEEIRIFVASIVVDGKSVLQAGDVMAKAIQSAYVLDCNNRVVVSEFVTDRRSGNSNKELRTKRNLLIQTFLLDCVSSESIYEKDDRSKAKRVPQLTAEEWDKVLQLLSKKKKAYGQKAGEIRQMATGFEELGLAPDLLEPDYQRFGLDESGNISNVIVSRKKKAKVDKHKGDQTPEKKNEDKDKIVLVDEKGEVINWFPGKGLDFHGSDTVTEPGAEEREGRVLQLANDRLSYLRTLSRKISDALATYAGNSVQKKPALLRKRNVSAGGNTDSGAARDFKYAKPSQEKETAPVESVLKTSRRAYETLIIEYLKFNASRAVSITTVRDQGQHYLNRVARIEESLEKLFLVLGILAAGLVMVFILPFLLIQWDTLFENVGTAVVALIHIAIPFVMLLLGYGFARAWQAHKIRKAWKDLMKLAETAGSGNQNAVEAYSKLLCRYIPALRWIYEYVLDVEFFWDCCRIAGAKLSHHRQKLDALCETLDNLLEDLEYDERGNNEPDKCEIDYRISYCEGINRSSYTIMDEEIMKVIRDRKEAQEK
jgi:hypothetical protein